MNKNQSIIAKGTAAIDLAEKDPTVQLNKYTDPTEEAREDIGLDAARNIVREDASLIYATRRAS